MAVALIANGHVVDSSETRRRLQQFVTLVAVDGGLNHCHRMHLIPSLILGDLDSIEPGLIDRYPTVSKKVYPRDKDATDLELALQELASSDGILTVFGALGLRLDHTLFNLHLLCRYPGKVVFENEDETIMAITGKMTLPCYPGQVVSFIPIGSPVQGVSTTGLRWELDNATLDKNFLSISNECLGSQVQISVDQGDLLCCLNRK